MKKLSELIPSKLTRIALIALAIAPLIAITISYLGIESSMATSLFSGLVAAFFSSAVVNGKAAIDDYTRNFFTIAKPICSVFLLCFFFGNQKNPTIAIVQHVFETIKTFGLFPVIFVPIASFIEYSSTHLSNREKAIEPCLSFLHGYTLYAFAIWGIGVAGDDIYRYISANPELVIVTATSCIIFWKAYFTIYNWFNGHSTSYQRGTALHGTGAVSGSAVAMFRPKPTHSDNQHTAAHEAGHALVYAALGGLPPDIKMAINENPDDDGILGFITRIMTQNRLESSVYAEWYMLVLLAGKMGENTKLNVNSLGCRNDHLRWLEVANIYLSNHHRGIFFIEPKNTFEHTQNSQKLEALQVEQLELLRKLFSLNTEVFTGLADTLLEKKTMGRDDLIPFLSQVKLPDGFPLPFGPFEKFGANLTE